MHSFRILTFTINVIPIRIANIQSGNHVVTKDEVRDIIDEAIWKSKKSKVKNFVDVLFSKRYDSQDMIVLKERDFI